MKICSIYYSLLHIVSGFGYETHKFLGNYLDIYLNKYEPSLYSNINITLQGNTIHDISIWADTMKKTKGYVWTRTLHYVDIMNCTSDIDYKILDTFCEDKCIFSAIIDFVSTFKYTLNPKFNLTKNEILKFIIHFIQDFNQPMHLLGYDQGGNNFEIVTKQHSGRNKSSNVHYLWDTLVPEFYINNYNFTYKNPKINEIKNENELNKLLLEMLNIKYK